MTPHTNKYGRNIANKELLEKRKQEKKEKMVKQKASEIKTAVILAIVAISIQVIGFVLNFIPATVKFTILPGILGVLVGGMAIGLVHSDKKKKMFVYVIFTANILIGVYSGYQFVESQQPKDLTKKELNEYDKFHSTFQQKLKEQALKDSLERVNAIQADTSIQVDTSTIK